MSAYHSKKKKNKKKRKNKNTDHFLNFNPVHGLLKDNYMFKVNNRNTRRRCEICSKLTMNIFHTLFWCFYC